LTPVSVKTNNSGMRAKITLLLLIIFVIPFRIFGQNNFVEFDSITYVGATVVDGGDRLNSSICQIKKGGEFYKYSPNEVKRYGFANGRIYVSKEIHINDTSVHRVFLEQLVNDKTTLYYYNGKAVRTFFIEKDSTLFTELPRNDIQNKKKGFHNILFNITSDCRNVSDATKLVLYNKRSLSKLIQRYNNCELKPFPFLKYGLIFGYGFTKLSPSSSGDPTYPSYLSGINFKYDPGYILGLFIDWPILASDLSFRSEFLYSRNGYSYNLDNSGKIIDLVINTTSLSIPVLFRYTLPTIKTRPFIELGGIYTYNIRNEGIEFESSKNNDVITVLNASYNPLISDKQVGYSFGGGVQFSLRYRNILSLGLRYSNLYRVSEQGSLNEKTIHLISSISF
jgi:hypothetical protein